MPLVIPAGHAQLRFVMSLLGDPEKMITTIGVQHTATNLAGMVAVCNQAFDAWRVRMLPHISNFYQLDKVVGSFGPSPGSVTAESTAAVAVAGNAGAALPQNNAILIKKRSGQGGRKHQGRMYVPGLAEGAVNNTGVIDTAVVTAWQNSANNFLADMIAAADINACVILHNDATLPSEILQLTVDNLLATQRTRLRR